MTCKTIVFFAFLCLTTIMVGQEARVDSLKIELKTAASDEVKLELLSQISEAYFDGQIYLDSSYYYAYQAHKIAKTTDNNYQKGRALFNLGLVETEFKNFDDALEHLLEAKEFVLKQDSAILLSIIYSNIGGLYLEKEEFPLAVENYQKAINISKQEKDTIGIAIDYINLGETNYKSGNYQQARQDLEYCMSLLDSIGESFASAELNYAKILDVLNDPEIAEMHALKAFEISKSDENSKGIYESAQFLSNLYHRKDNHKDALHYLKLAYVQKQLLNDAKELNEIEKLKLNVALSIKEAELSRLSQGDVYKTFIYVLGGIGVLLLVLLISRQLRIRNMKEQIHAQQTKLFASEVEALSRKDELFKAFYSGKEQNLDPE